MTKATRTEDILQIVENFVLIRRKHHYLFQHLKNTVLRNVDQWSAPDFAALGYSLGQLGYSHEDLCVAMAERVVLTAHTCNTQELCLLLDTYASARCSVQSVSDEVTRRTMLNIDCFTLPQLCLHASSYARLSLKFRPLFDYLAARLTSSADAAGPGPRLRARDLTLVAFSFAKLGYHDSEVFSAIGRAAIDVSRSFTARDLQVLIVAFARAQHRDERLLEVISLQAQRRMAQFNGETLALFLRAMAFFDVRDGALFTRAVAQLPRSILAFRPADVATLVGAFAAAGVHSSALFDLVTPFILERAPMLTLADWLCALRGYSTLGCRDASFLDALSIHLDFSRLTSEQLDAVLADCRRLSWAFEGSGCRASD